MRSLPESGETKVMLNILRAIFDVVASPFVRSYLRQVALRTPIFPGQVWFLPMIGDVLIVGATDETVSYLCGESIYSTQRAEFVKYCQDPDVPELRGTLIHLNREK